MSFEVIEELKQDLQKRARSRLLMQFKDSVVLRKVLEALVKEVQTFSDAVADVMTFRTPAQAFGEQLDGVGRIVGQAREGFTYDENIWFAPDIVGQNVDVAFAWVPGGYLLGTYLPDDETYRRLIEAKVFRNFSKYGSVEEVQIMFAAAFGFPISFVRTDMMEVDVIVPEGLPDYALGAIVNFQDTAKVDQRGLLPWPATLSIRQVLSAATEVLVDTAAFTRASSAYLSDGSSVANDEPRFENGGVLLEEGTTNLLSDNEASADTDLTGWAGVNGTITRTTDEFFVGTHSVLCTSTVNGEFGTFCPTRIAVSPGQVVSAQARIFKGTTNAPVRVRIQFNDSGGSIIGGSSNAYVDLVDGQWVLSEATATAPAGTSYAIVTTYSSSAGQVGDTFYVDARMIEVKGFSSSFQFGTRGAEKLNIPTTNIVDRTEATIEIDLVVTQEMKTNRSRIFEISQVGGVVEGFVLEQSSNLWQFRSRIDGEVFSVLTSSSVETTLGLRRFSVTWSQAALRLYIDGVLLDEVLDPNLPPSIQDQMNVGRYEAGSTFYINTELHGVKISSVEKTASEILAGIGAPLRLDKHTTALLHLDENLSVVGPLQKYHHLLP